LVRETRGYPAGGEGDADHRARIYKSYVDFQASPDHCGDRSDEVFALEIERTGVRPPARILEIGFGVGHFLDWARRQGYTVTGVEIIDEFVEAATARGHTVFAGTAQSTISLKNDQFDLIVAFDVFEHLSVGELLNLFDFLKQILSSDGLILARFPNGSSPFGAHYQNGDATHATALNKARMGQIAAAAGMRLIFAGNSARPIRSGRRNPVVRKMAYFVRDLIERAVGLVYFGERVPLDPNLTVVIGKSD